MMSDGKSVRYMVIVIAVGICYEHGSEYQLQYGYQNRSKKRFLLLLLSL